MSQFNDGACKEKVSLKSTFIRTIKIYIEYKKALQQMKLKQK